MTYFDLVLRPSRNVTTRSRMSSAFGEVNVYSSPFTFASVKLWPCILPVLQQSSTSTQPVWLIGAMVCLLAAPWVQSVRTGNGWPHNALLHHWLMPISCHFRDCKALLVMSLTHVNGAVASVLTFTFYSLAAQHYKHRWNYEGQRPQW